MDLFKGGWLIELEYGSVCVVSVSNILMCVGVIHVWGVNECGNDQMKWLWDDKNAKYKDDMI